MISNSIRPQMVRLCLTLPRLLIIVALCAHISFAAENNTVDGVEMLSKSTMENKEELILDQKLKEAFESAKRTLDTYNDAKSQLLTLSNEIIEGKDKADGIVSQMEDLEKMKEEISEKTERVDKRIREINALQIMDLKAKIELLHERELERRALLKEKEELQTRQHERRKLKKDKKRKKKEKLKKKNRKSLSKMKKKKSKKNKTIPIPEGAIKKDELRDKVDVKALMEESDKRIEDLFVDIVEQEVEALQGDLEETVIDATSALQEYEDEEKNKDTPSTSDDCSGATLTDAVQLVQESLVKFSHDKVGMVDHLARAHVVHHLTSENFVPPSYSYQSLDDSWWFQYLPEDWEKGFDAVLPTDWRKWNVAVPDYLYHTVRMNGRATTAPPEAILKPNLYPGSCWPMAGHEGQVTLRLPYPVKVKAVTIDHAPSLLFEDQTKRQSAPRNLRVFGFPPCWTKKATGKNSAYSDDYLDDGVEDDAEYYRGTCDDGLDFDVSKGVVLHDFEYDLEGPSIQTFHIPLADEDDEGSCGEDTVTCGGSLDGNPVDPLLLQPGRSDTIDDGMSAIRLQVTDNWGNKDYTCIYRFRIHGDPIDQNE